MSAEIISFTYRRQEAIRDAREPDRRRQRLVFMNRAVILEVDGATLLRNVCRDLGKAERKLTALRQHLAHYKTHSAEQIKMLTAVEAKLGAAVDGARQRLEEKPVLHDLAEK